MTHDILIVEDEADIRLLVGGLLGDEGYQTREAVNSDQALEAIAYRRPSLVLLDVWLNGSKLDGLGILAKIKQDHPMVPVVMMSGHGNIESAVNAIKHGAYEFIEKPFQTDRLLLVVERAIESARLRREIEQLKVRVGGGDELIGSSTAMNQLRQSIERVAPTGSRVLLTGPAGVGKEVVARQLHKYSKRAEGPFVVVNCAAMHPERMEIELFGIDLQAEITAGRFREDLYYRLNVVPLRLPALRDRREDIPALAEHFMIHAAQINGLPPRPLREDAMAAIQAYDWPGNIRQLRNVMDWLLIMAPGDPREPIRADMLPPEVGAITPSVLRWEKSSEIMTLPLREAREVFEREYLLSQVTRYGGNISRTASFVGMERSALHRKLKSLGVNTDEKTRG